MISRNDVLAGGYFTTVDNGTVSVYDVRRSTGNGRYAPAWFVRLATETESLYVGRLNTRTGLVQMTGQSTFPANHRHVTLINRVLGHVWAGDRIGLEAAGVTVRKGTPTDAPAPAPVATPAPTPAPAPPTRNERKREQVENLTVGREKRYVGLHYDIHGRAVGDPCATLHRYAIRWTESVWIVPTACLPLLERELFAEWNANGVTWGTLEFDLSQQSLIRDLAKKDIDGWTVEIHTGVINTIADADRQLQEALETAGTWQERERKTKYRDARIKARIKDAGAKLNAAIEAAMRFDCTGETEDAIAALRQGLAAANAAFQASVDARYANAA